MMYYYWLMHDHFLRWWRCNYSDVHVVVVVDDNQLDYSLMMAPTGPAPYHKYKQNDSLTEMIDN